MGGQHSVATAKSLGCRSQAGKLKKGIQLANTSTSNAFGSTSMSICVMCGKESEPSLWPSPWEGATLTRLQVQIRCHVRPEIMCWPTGRRFSVHFHPVPAAFPAYNIVPVPKNKHHPMKHFKRILLNHSLQLTYRESRSSARRCTMEKSAQVQMMAGA